MMYKNLTTHLLSFCAGIAVALFGTHLRSQWLKRLQGEGDGDDYDPQGEPQAPKAPLPCMSCSKWRVRNAEEIEDHWNIGELNMMTADGHSTHRFIRRVLCSTHYDDHDLSVVHNDEYNTSGHANPRTWAGDDTRRGQRVGGSW